MSIHTDDRMGCLIGLLAAAASAVAVVALVYFVWTVLL